MESSSTFKRISSAIRDIEKIPAPFEIPYFVAESPGVGQSRQICVRSSGNVLKALLVRSSHTPGKLFPTIDSLPRKRLSMFATIESMSILLFQRILICIIFKLSLIVL
ncbi:hypothetical protein AVEN_159700-1 [Araneus ventricosus]|uniref:Uncharacterized protein n=1 Tax=Araneus ventricosus TaxID=182803 RepID=A0A4Y2M3G0_ARAVE|nr:hypothetical protein AVEN_159700-1 [Araneus ventricosus]